VSTDRRIGVVWGVLVLATAVSWLTGTEFGNRSDTAATAALLAVAFFKVRLVGLHFMDLRGAPRGLRLWFEAYIAIVAATLLGLAIAA
jgi:hypothetical protein